MSPDPHVESRPRSSVPGSGSERIYAKLLRLYPVEFRGRFGDSMRFVFATQAREARGRGLMAFAWFWCRSLWHIGAFGLAERLTPRRAGEAWRHGLAIDIAHAARRLRRAPPHSLTFVVRPETTPLALARVPARRASRVDPIDALRSS